MIYIGKFLYLILPIILAGISNMIFMKLPLFSFLKKPMDFGIILKDGKRLLGENKTIKGFLGIIFFTAFWTGVVGFLTINIEILDNFSLLAYSKMTSPLLFIFYGAWMGLGYALFELPNSILKRRLGIGAGKNAEGFIGILFIIIDQVDSIIGCAVFMLLFYRPGVMEFITIILLGSFFHYLLNLLLYFAGLKKQAG